MRRSVGPVAITSALLAGDRSRGGGVVGSGEAGVGAGACVCGSRRIARSPALHRARHSAIGLVNVGLCHLHARGRQHGGLGAART